jgi:hypothetical protein
MTPVLKRLGIPLTILIGGTAIIFAIWWVNGAEREDVWLYAIAVCLVFYAAYELFSEFNKRKGK